MVEQTMVERVAIAMAAENNQWMETEGEGAAWTDLARAAIEAMREPNEPMIDRFVSRALCVSIHGEGGWSEYGRNQWRTMIDAALATDPAA